MHRNQIVVNSYGHDLSDGVEVKKPVLSGPVALLAIVKSEIVVLLFGNKKSNAF